MNSGLILGVMGGYFGVLLLVAWLTGRKNGGSNEAFFLGNRQSPWYIVSIGMIGSSLSGVTFVSVPGLVRQTDMTYMQMVVGFFFGYVVIAHVLLPLYYKLKVTSIYVYLKDRLGPRSYHTGAVFFLLSKTIGAAVRFYLVVLILQTSVFGPWGIPFTATAAGAVFLIWLYTCRNGIRTIIWTDTLQALCLVGMLILILVQVKELMHLEMGNMLRTIMQNPHFRLVEWADWGSRQHVMKQFVSGIFITIVMTGLDQDMMQKNLTCRTLKEAQKNMYIYGMAFTPINFLFLCLGILMLVFAAQQGVALPAGGDEMLPYLCTSGLWGQAVLIFFTVGIVAAAFSSADSALTALTTSFCVDLLGVEQKEALTARRIRRRVHRAVALVFLFVILIIRAVNNRSLIDAIYTVASYTYGPLLGLFAFGLFTKRKPADRLVPYICILSPLLCLAIEYGAFQLAGYRVGYEILLLNGALTFTGLFIYSRTSYTC
jgi:Na+/proline symporter